MNRVKVDSSSIHSIGHDETGLEVQFHAKDCPATTWKPVGPTEKMTPGVCNCSGGDCYHYPGVPAELHSMVMAAPSIGAFFAKNVKGARHPQTKELLYPHVKALMTRNSVSPELRALFPLGSQVGYSDWGISQLDPRDPHRVGVVTGYGRGGRGFFCCVQVKWIGIKTPAVLHRDFVRPVTASTPPATSA